VSTIEREKPARPRVTRQAWIDITVLAVLSLLGILGFETSFGGLGFLVASVGGLVLGVAVAVLSFQFGVGIPLTAIGAVVVYFLFGTAIAVPSLGIGFAVPTLNSLGSLAIGAAYGWKDILTLTTPIGAPAYISAVPYVASWFVGTVFATLAVRWLPRHPRSSWRYAVALAGPIALYVVGVLVGTDQPVLAGIRGISFAVITLVWLGWRRLPNQSASTSANRALLRRKVVGTIVIAAIAAVVAGGLGAIVPPTSYARYVLRDKITPPFDPLQYPSPLSAFRYYTKTAARTKLFTVTGLKSGDYLRLATMDSYTGQVWNVVGTDANSDGSGSFDLVGTRLPTQTDPARASKRTIAITVDGYSGVWIPMVGDPEALLVKGTVAGEDVHFNPVTGTAALTGAEGGVSTGAQFDLIAEVPRIPRAATLEKTATASPELPAVYPIDAIAAQAQKHEGSSSTSNYRKLVSLAAHLKTGYLSHGTTASPSPSGHGANRMIAMFPPNGTLVGDAEQYASAFALEARALGLPARVVMGFKPKITAGERTVTVVGSDVTAWDEVDFQGVGWVPFYPTPIKTGTPPKTPPPPVSQTITQSVQPNRVGQPQNNVLSPVAIKKPKAKPSGFVIPGWVFVTAGIVAIPLAIYFVPLLIIASLKRRRRRRRATRGRGDERVAGAWDELTDSFAELGYRVPRGLTRLNAARTVQRQFPPDADKSGPTLVEFAATADEAVFSGEDVPGEWVESAWSLASQEIGRARAAAPGWRRWLAAFRVRSKRGLPPVLSAIDTAAVTGRVKELVNR
jgi:transglutaminase-like putative cysteine protease